MHGIQKEVPKDRIANWYISAGRCRHAWKSHIRSSSGSGDGSTLYVYGKMGGQYKVIGGKLLTDSRKVRYPVRNLQTREYPGFPTDLVVPFLAKVFNNTGSQSGGGNYL